jgi:serine/threonine-protein kinase
VADLNEELGLFFRSFPGSVFLAGMVWLVYIALEPFLRRRWPDAMVSWSRLLAGRFRDPLIGRDILVGGCAFGGTVLLSEIGLLAGFWLGAPPPSPQGNLNALLGGRRLISLLADGLLVPILFAGGLLLMLLILRVILRKHWLAVGAVVILFSLPALTLTDPKLILVGLSTNLLFWSTVYFVLSRFGLLSICACFFFLIMLGNLPDSSLSAWYAGNTITILLIMAAVLGYGFFTSLAGRSLFAESMVPQE